MKIHNDWEKYTRISTAPETDYRYTEEAEELLRECREQLAEVWAILAGVAHTLKED